MDLVHLEARLEADGFNMRHIRLNRANEHGTNDVHCIEDRGDGWAIYYLERGGRFDERFFASEGEACEAFLAWLREFPYLRGR